VRHFVFLTDHCFFTGATVESINALFREIVVQLQPKSPLDSRIVKFIAHFRDFDLSRSFLILSFLSALDKYLNFFFLILSFCEGFETPHTTA